MHRTKINLYETKIKFNNKNHYPKHSIVSLNKRERRKKLWLYSYNM